MLLSKPQKYLLDILRQFGTIREEHAERLLAMHSPDIQAQVQLRQLVLGGLIRQNNGLIYLPDVAPDVSAAETIEIMLLTEPEQLPVFQKGVYPFSLTFFKEREQKLWRYDICHVKTGLEIAVTAALEGLNPKYRMVILVLDRPDQRLGLSVPCEHCFAWKQDGVYRFYKPSERKD